MYPVDISDHLLGVMVRVSEDGRERNVTLLRVTTDTCEHTLVRIECDGDCVREWHQGVEVRVLNPDTSHPGPDGLVSCDRRILITNSSFENCSLGLIITNVTIDDPCGNFSTYPGVDFCDISRLDLQSRHSETS